MKKYYLQDSRTVIGNCAVWWGKNRTGYVTDLRDAYVFDESEKAETAVRDVYIWHEKEKIDALAELMVDV